MLLAAVADDLAFRASPYAASQGGPSRAGGCISKFLKQRVPPTCARTAMFTVGQRPSWKSFSLIWDANKPTENQSEPPLPEDSLVGKLKKNRNRNFDSLL
jgi:hypothetical protein